jgi:cytochrome o ubiquinol oxidase operon protein cyoD
MSVGGGVVAYPDGGGAGHGQGGAGGGGTVGARSGPDGAADGHSDAGAGHRRTGGGGRGDGGGDGSAGGGHGGAGGGHGDDVHVDAHGAGAAHFTLRGYVTGFMAAVILTAIPFWLVMGRTFGSSNITAAVILTFAAVQIVVHMVYFLHMNAKSEGGWNLLALLFTVMLVVIALSGSLWVMYHLNHNMMPESMQNMPNMP